MIELSREPEVEVTMGSSAAMGERKSHFKAMSYQAHSHSTYYVPGSVLSSFHSPNNPIREVTVITIAVLQMRKQAWGD